MPFMGNIFEARITDVIDGDTVDCDIDLGFGIWYIDQRIRLSGLDTPECRTRDLMEKRFGLMAKNKMLDMLPIGSTCVLRTYDVGKYGRILGDFWTEETDGKSVVEIMIEEHYGVEYHGQNRQDIEDEHIANRHYFPYPPTLEQLQNED